MLGAGLGCGVTAQPNPGNRPDSRGAAIALSAEATVPKGLILPDEFRPFSTIISLCARAPFATPGDCCPAEVSPDGGAGSTSAVAAAVSDAGS